MIRFFITNFLLGCGLAMDAFSVSLADGLAEPDMKAGRKLFIAGLFGLFQAVMPLAGWFCVHTILKTFVKFAPFIPWIALILLCWIGGKMIFDSFHPEEETPAASFKDLILQAFATSIDALSVGFTIAAYDFSMAAAAVVIIGLVTFVICIAGVELGRRFGTRLAGKATLAGGIILVCIGLEIWITSFI